MKARTILFLIAASFCATPAMASDNLSFSEIVVQSGLTKQQVRMLIGARTPYPTYRAGYNRLRKQLVSTVGRARFDELVIELKYRAPHAVNANAG